MSWLFILTIILVIFYIVLEARNAYFYMQSRRAIQKEKNSQDLCIFLNKTLNNKGKIIALSCCHPHKGRKLPTEGECFSCNEGIVKVEGLDYLTACIMLKGYWGAARIVVSVLLATITIILNFYKK